MDSYEVCNKRIFRDPTLFSKNHLEYQLTSIATPVSVISFHLCLMIELVMQFDERQSTTV